MSRSTRRDLRVGLMMLAAALGLLVLFVVAAGGPGYLTTNHESIDVYFRDGQGVRSGHPVRIAGLDAGRVTDVDVVEYEGTLRARVRIALSEDLASRLRQDAVIVIQAGLTGQSCVNIASVGESDVAWVPGQPIEGVESSLFDPLLEEIGLGPVERGHLSHTIAEVRRTVDETAPRLQKILASFQQAADDIEQATKVAGPSIAGASDRLDQIAPKLETMVLKAEGLVTELEAVVKENREGVKDTVSHVEQLSGDARDLIAQNGPKLSELIAKLDQTRVRLDRVLYRADVIGEDVEGLVARNAPEIDRTIQNVRDLTNYGRLTVQKIHANPLVISPLYKPSRDAEVALANYDTAQEFLMAARELNDAVRRLQALREHPLPGQQSRQAIDQMLRQAFEANAKLDPIARQLANGIQAESTARGRGLLQRD